MAEKQYTRQAQEALNMARKIAAELKHPYVGTEHLLFGLKRVFTGVAGQVLDKNKVDEESDGKSNGISLYLLLRQLRRKESIWSTVRDFDIFWKKARMRQCSLHLKKSEPNIFCLQCLKMEIVWLPVC